MSRVEAVPTSLPEEPDPDAREVSLFRNGRNQALRIPREWELPGEKAMIRKEGNRLVIEPVEEVPERSTRSLVEWLKTLEPTDPNEEPWVDPDDPPAEAEDVFADWDDER